MTTIAAENKSESPLYAHGMLRWGMVGLGLASMYVPTLFALATGLWQSDQQAHGPIVLAVFGWLTARRFPEAFGKNAVASPPRLALAWPLFLLGFALYVVGRSQDVPTLEVGSIVPVLVATTLFLGGTAALKALWFPLFFIIFMIPLPGTFVDAVTLPMKIAVSIATEKILFFLGYPIARSGVILQIGQYQLLVADACAGLHTLFSLEAMGLLYLNVVRYQSMLRNALLALLIVPLSFSANVVRVILLSLITFHLGDEAGRGFLHGFAGLTLFITALLLIIGIDTLLRKLIGQDSGPIATSKIGS